MTAKKKTVEELRPGWHRHENGGGWVEDSAHVDSTAYVGPYAQVRDNAQVYGYAQVFGKAQVCGYARVYGKAQVYDDARVFGKAQVYDDAQVCGYAQVLGKAQVYGTLVGGRWDISPLTIQGTQDMLSICSDTEIAIGCKVHSDQMWSRKAREIGKRNGYTDREIAEYREYIRVARRWRKRVSR